MSRIIIRGVFYSALCAVLLASRFSHATETGFGPTPIYSADLHGDFVVAGAYTRVSGVSTPQTTPFSVTLAGIPAGATVVKAYANWSYQTLSANTNAAVESALKINGNLVAGAL